MNSRNALFFLQGRVEQIDNLPVPGRWLPGRTSEFVVKARFELVEACCVQLGSLQRPGGAAHAFRQSRDILLRDARCLWSFANEWQFEIERHEELPALSMDVLQNDNVIKIELQSISSGSHQFAKRWLGVLQQQKVLAATRDILLSGEIGKTLASEVPASHRRKRFPKSDGQSRIKGADSASQALKAS